MAEDDGMIAQRFHEMIFGKESAQSMPISNTGCSRTRKSKFQMSCEKTHAVLCGCPVQRIDVFAAQMFLSINAALVCILFLM